MLLNPAADSAAAIDVPTITTSEDVLRLAECKGTHAKLKTVAEAWHLGYIDIYNEWYDKGCSRDFLIQLVKLSQLVGVYDGRQILLDCKKTRNTETGVSAKVWAMMDAKLAVSKATELGFAHNSDNTSRPGRTVRMARNLHAAGSKSNGSTGAIGTRKRLRKERDFVDVRETHAPGPNETYVPTTGRSIEPAGTANTSAQQHSDAVGALVDSLDTRARQRRKENTAFTPSAAPRQFPLTPSSATSADPGPCSIIMADNSRSSCSPSQPAQPVVQGHHVVSDADQQAVEEDSMGHSDAAYVSNEAQSAVEAHQPVSRGDAQTEWTDDYRTDVLLRTFNPNPSVWYIVPTQTVEADQAVSATLPEIKDAESLPAMVLIPLRGADGAQRTLIIFDRTRAHCLVFDAGGSTQVAKVAWSTAQTFLTRTEILQGEASVDLDPFPSIRLKEGVSYGIFLVVVALYKLYGETINCISPRLWRGLLAGFFPDENDPPQERLKRLLGGLTKLTRSEAEEGVGIERNVEDAESLHIAKTTVQTYVKQARLLLQMTEAQLRSEEKRKRLAKYHEWLLTKPSDADELRSEVAALETKLLSQLGTLPEIPEWCERQLLSIRNSCRHAVDECEQAALNLEARRKAMVETAEAKYKLLGARLLSVCP